MSFKQRNRKRITLLIAGLFLLCVSCFDSDEVDFDQQLKTELEQIDQYLADNGIAALSDSTDQIRFVVHVRREEGKLPTLDSCVRARFKGKILSTGEAFTSESDIAFPLAGTIIEGLKLGIPLLHQGDSATFYIPAVLAYGASGLPVENIPPSENIFFDFKLISVGSKYSTTSGCK